MASWTYIGGRSSVELHFPALDDALRKRIPKKQHPISNQHKILLVLLQHSEVELFLCEFAGVMCQSADTRNHM